jgi:uncharacterized membrane protein (UPF0136 family)
VSAYLPSSHDLICVGGLALALALLLALGTAATGRRGQPEIALAAGWGIACLVLTAWGVLTPWLLQWPAVALGLVAIAWLVRAGRRARIGIWTRSSTRPLSSTPSTSATGLARVLLLALPLWLVMLSVRPSQIDTWLNLLPNAAYLFDHGVLPTAHLPPSYSFLPVAPYNSQFVAFLASLASGAFADSAMSLLNIALLCASALLLARVVAATEKAPPWWACAAGLLLVVPLNAGFVPRDFLSPYGEASLAVTTLFAVWLGTELLDDLARGVCWPRAIVPLALVLAALVNIKQSAIGLLVSIGVSLLVLACADPRIPRRRAVAASLAALAPAMALYLLWRDFAVHSFVAGELKPLPLAAWNVTLLPWIVLAVLKAMFQKATFFVCVAAVLAIAVVQLRRAPWSREGHQLGLIAGVILLFTGFLLFTYVAHFPPDWALRAHSFFRYESQVSLLVMLGLLTGLRPAVASWMMANPRPIQHAGHAAVGLILLLPLATAPLLRFDLDTPQPELWRLGHAAAAYVAPGNRLALVLPGDTDDSVGSMLRGVLLFTPPRRPGLDLRTETGPAARALSRAAIAGYRLALVTCTPPGIYGVPAGVAAMLRDTPDGWRPLQTWPWPTSLKTQRFAALLARAPLCAAPAPSW